MKLIFVLLTCYLNLIYISESKKCRVIVDDQILPYEIDKHILPVTEHFSFDDFILEQVVDDNVVIGGQLRCTKAMDPKLPMVTMLKTQYYEKAVWNEGAIRLTVPDMCNEMTNPRRFWYNITKLWTSCPAKLGDIWPIEQQSINVQIDLPPSMPSGTWKAYVLLTQGIPRMEKTKFGFSIKFELLPY